MELPEFKILTQKGVLLLKCIDSVEPNNGRMLYKVNLFLDDKNITEEYFDSWNYIAFYLNQYSPSNDEWIYIPKEGQHFLVKISSLEKISLPEVPLFAASFIKNIFVDHYLIVLCNNQIICKNLVNGTVINIEQDHKKVYFRNLKLLNLDKIEIELIDSSSRIIDLNDF